MISSRIRMDTKIKYRFPENAKANKAKATISEQPNNSVLSRAFAAQRLELFEQPSSSKDLRFTALDKLEQRNFRPAPGGLEIPLTGKAMGGMPKRTSRVNAPYIPEEASGEVSREYYTQARNLVDQINQQRLIIQNLSLQILQTDLTEEQIQSVRERLATARNTLDDLQVSMDGLPERMRQAQRGRGQGSSAESSSHAGSQRGWHPGSYSGSRRG